MGQIPEIYQPCYYPLVDNYVVLVYIIVNGYFSQFMGEGEYIFQIQFDKLLCVLPFLFILHVMQVLQQ